LLSKAIAVFGDRCIGELTSQEIAEWRMNLSPGYRFEATQAVRQVLGRAVVWGMLDVNPAKVGVDNPTPRRKEQHPFESWEELEAVAAALARADGPMILFAAATGLRPAEWVALEWRDIDRDERVAYVRRSYTRRELKLPKTEASLRAVPLQGRALDALDQLPECDSHLVFPGERGAYLECTTSAPTNGGQHRKPRASRGYAGSTISDTPLRPSLSVPASRPLICPDTWGPA
jgi:integrase